MNVRRRPAIFGLVAVVAIVLAASLVYLVSNQRINSASTSELKGNVPPGPDEQGWISEPSQLLVSRSGTTTFQTGESDAEIRLLEKQLQCAETEVSVIATFFNNFDNSPTNFSSQSHFDTKLNQCFVLLQYTQFNGTISSPVQALYNASLNKLILCYDPIESSTDYQTYETDCPHLSDPFQEYTTDTYNPLMVNYMTE